MNMEKKVAVQKNIFAGPININGTTKQITTAMGTSFDVNALEYEILVLLVLHENTSFSIEDINHHLTQSNISTTHADIKKSIIYICNKISILGEGFAWIEPSPNNQYTFKTKWGHNWQQIHNDTQKIAAESLIFVKKQAIKKQITTRKVMTITGLIAVSILMAVVFQFIGMTPVSVPDNNYVYVAFDDTDVPLGLFEPINTKSCLCEPDVHTEDCVCECEQCIDVIANE